MFACTAATLVTIGCLGGTLPGRRSFSEKKKRESQKPFPLLLRFRRAEGHRCLLLPYAQDQIELTKIVSVSKNKWTERGTIAF
jgi:hypothetical protein